MTPEEEAKLDINCRWMDDNIHLIRDLAPEGTTHVMINEGMLSYYRDANSCFADFFEAPPGAAMRPLAEVALYSVPSNWVKS